MFLKKRRKRKCFLRMIKYKKNITVQGMCYGIEKDMPFKLKKCGKCPYYILNIKTPNL